MEVEDAPSIIYTEIQIQKLIDKRNDNQSNASGQLISDSSESNTSTPNITNTHKTKRAHKNQQHPHQKTSKHKTNKKARRKREKEQPACKEQSNNKHWITTEPYHRKSNAPTPIATATQQQLSSPPNSASRYHTNQFTSANNIL